METTAVAVFASTRPADLVAALARLHVPYAASFMLAMTLELVPVLRHEMGIVLAAQRARAMRRSGFGAVIPAFVPMFVGTIERMQRLAVSLEARGFGVTGPRTSYRRVRFALVDRLVALAVLAAGVAGVILGLVAWGADSVPALDLSAPLAIGIVVTSGVVFVGVILAGARAITRA
jgi:energy-coupling factor transport system permease protein